MSSSANPARSRAATAGRSPLHKRVLALVASLSMLAIGLVGIVMAPAADAHNYTVALQCTGDPSVPKLTLNLSSYPSGSSWSVSGAVSESGNFGGGLGNVSKNWTLTPATSSHSVSVTVTSSDDGTSEAYTANPLAKSGGSGYSYSFTWNATVDPCQAPPVLAGSVEVTDTCALVDVNGQWTVSWEVTNTSLVPVNISTPPGLTASSSTSNVAPASSVTFTKVVNDTSQIPAQTFTLSATGSTNVNVTSNAYTPSGQCPTPASPEISVTVDDTCVPSDGEWTITWTVTNESDSPVTVTPPAGLSPSGGQLVAAGATKDFTKVVTSNGSYPAEFTASWDVNSRTSTASATAELEGTCDSRTPSISVSVDETCVPADGEWTITWTVTNNSSKTVTVTPPAGLSPSGGQSVAAGATKKFTKVVTENGSYPAEFTASWDVNGRTSTASDTATLEGTCQLYYYSKQETVTKTICTPRGTIVDATATGEKISADPQDTEFTKDQTDGIDAQALASANDAFNNKYGNYTEGACKGTDPQSFTYERQVTITKDICTADGTVTGATATGEKFSQTKDTDFSADEKKVIDDLAAGSATTAFNAKYGTYTDGVCKPLAVVAPAAATVAAAKPAKKPVVVAAPKPAKVNGGVAGSVAVPQSATVPASVPAGDGSQAPGLPMWALALVVAGAIGAAAAGKQLVGSRK